MYRPRLPRLEPLNTHTIIRSVEFNPLRTRGL